MTPPTLCTRLAVCALSVQLWQVQQDAQRSRQRMQRLQHRLGELHQELGGAKKAATVRTQALVTTLKVMKAADRWASRDLGGCFIFTCHLDTVC